MIAACQVRPPRSVTLAVDRFPVGVRHVRDKNVALLERGHLVNRRQYPDLAGAYALTDRAPLDQDCGPLGERVAGRDARCLA